MKKKIIGVMLSAMMLTVTILSGCSSGNEENTANSTKDKEKDGTYDIVVMPKLVGVPFYTSCEEGTKKAAEEFSKILYLIFDYPHKHYTFKYFEV